MKEKDKNNDNLSINWFVAEEDFSDNKKKKNEAAWKNIRKYTHEYPYMSGSTCTWFLQVCESCQPFIWFHKNTPLLILLRSYKSMQV